MYTENLDAILESRIPYSRQLITKEDRKAVDKVLQSDWVAGNGPIVRQFEEELCEYTGWKHAVAVNSATSGLMVACLLGLPVASGKFTIPDLTFVATANAIFHAGWHQSNIKIVDVDPVTLVKNRLTIGVSYAGHPVKGCAIADDAHYLHPDSSKMGNHISVVSFHPLKPLTTGEGGVIFTNDEGIYRMARGTTDHGRGRSRYRFGYGYNMRMPSINAALGLSQLKRAREDLSRREEIARIYMDILGNCSDIRLPPVHPSHAWHLFVIRTEMPRDLLRDALDECGIGTDVHYRPLHHYPHLTPRGDREFPISELMWRTGLSIPMYSSLPPENAEKIATIIVEIHQRWRKSL